MKAKEKGLPVYEVTSGSVTGISVTSDKDAEPFVVIGASEAKDKIIEKHNLKEPKTATGEEAHKILREYTQTFKIPTGKSNKDLDLPNEIKDELNK